MSAQHIFDTAPLGALVRFSDGSPQPPARFTNKLAAWENSNGTGRLTAKSGSSQMGSFVSPPGFDLHLGSYGSGGVIVLTVTRHYSVNSRLAFKVLEQPAPGMVRVLQRRGAHIEMLHLAPSQAAAESWLAKNRYHDAEFEIVTDGEAVVALPALEKVS